MHVCNYYDLHIYLTRSPLCNGLFSATLSQLFESHSSLLVIPEMLCYVVLKKAINALFLEH